MHRLRHVVLYLVLACLVGLLHRTSARAEEGPAAAIRHLLETQTAAWNRGDIAGFMTGYDDSEQTTFVGKGVTHGYQNVLARYQATYASRAAMGDLAFRDLEIRPIDSQVAVVTGHYHLKRAAVAGGDADGVFSLVFHHTRSGWKIILDHTS